MSHSKSLGQPPKTHVIICNCIIFKIIPMKDPEIIISAILQIDPEISYFSVLIKFNKDFYYISVNKVGKLSDVSIH